MSYCPKCGHYVIPEDPLKLDEGLALCEKCGWIGPAPELKVIHASEV